MEKNKQTIISISIVSHGHSSYLVHLLDDLNKCIGACIEVIITFNIPETHSLKFDDYSFSVKVLHNQTPKGFSANHNAAFKICSGNYFIVLNPDIRFSSFDLSNLLKIADEPQTGVVGPLVVSSNGEVEDSARVFPTVRSLLQRFFNRSSLNLDYSFKYKKVQSVDWLAGMFLLFRRDVFLKIEGFDQRYFLYCEDIDICKKLEQIFLDRKIVLNFKIVHYAQRKSQTLSWLFAIHVVSHLKYFIKWYKI